MPNDDDDLLTLATFYSSPSFYLPHTPFQTALTPLLPAPNPLERTRPARQTPFDGCPIASKVAPFLRIKFLPLFTRLVEPDH